MVMLMDAVHEAGNQSWVLVRSTQQESSGLINHWRSCGQLQLWSWWLNFGGIFPRSGELLEQAISQVEFDSESGSLLKEIAVRLRDSEFATKFAI